MISDDFSYDATDITNRRKPQPTLPDPGFDDGTTPRRPTPEGASVVAGIIAANGDVPLPPPDGLVTTEQAAQLLDVDAAAIRMWRSRGKVMPAQVVDGRGRKRLSPLYRLDDLRPLAEAYHARRHAAAARC